MKKVYNWVLNLKKGLFHIWHGEPELATYSASSTLHGGHAAANMFDENFNIFWHSLSNDLNPIVTINLKVSFKDHCSETSLKKY